MEVKSVENKKTAFVLSGGGSRGAYEAGVWQALIELNIDVDIVTGTSVGAINGAMFAQQDFEGDVGLWKELETDMIFDVARDSQTIDYAKEFILKKGAGTSGLQKKLTKHINEDAIRNSKIEFGLVVTELPLLKPHFLFKEDIPQGKMNDYILASASAFPAIHSHQIDGKEYVDGGYADVLPVKMALSKGATKIIAVYLEAVGNAHPEDYENLDDFTLIQSKWDLGNFLVFNTKNSKRIIRLGYLDALKAFGVFEGSYFTFSKGIFDKRSINKADITAKIFNLNPLCIYTEDVYFKKLKEAIIDAKEELNHLKGLSIFSFNHFDKLKDILRVTNKKSATLLIAENIRDKGVNSIFMARHTSNVLLNEIESAKFLYKHKLI